MSSTDILSVIAAHESTLSTDEQRATFDRVRMLVIRSYADPPGSELITNPFLARDVPRRAVATPVAADSTISTTVQRTE